MWNDFYNFLYQTSDLKLILTVSSILMSISLISLYLIKWYFPLHLRYKDNAVIGFTSAFIGLIYGVLAGFATAHLINNFNASVDAVQHEANAIVDLYRDSAWLRDPTKTTVIESIQKYLNEIIKVEFPLMSNGDTVSSHGADIINTISTELSKYKITNNSDTIIVADAMTIIRSLFDARQERILLSYASLKPEIWYVILMGTILTLCISYLYGVNFYLHIATAICSTLMISYVIFLLISLDKPFQGDYIVGPEAYASLKPLIGQNVDSNEINALEAEPPELALNHIRSG